MQNSPIHFLETPLPQFELHILKGSLQSVAVLLIKCSYNCHIKHWIHEYCFHFVDILFLLIIYFIYLKWRDSISLSVVSHTKYLQQQS